MCSVPRPSRVHGLADTLLYGSIETISVGKILKKMVVLSIDIGSTNFGWSRWTPERGFYDFGLLNLKNVNGRDLPEKMHTLYEKGFFDAEIILVERQMRAKFKCCATAIRCLGDNFKKTRIISPQSVKRHFSTMKLNHRENKKAHMELASTFMSEEELKHLTIFKKKDDICDTIIQTRYFVEKNNIV